MKDSERRVADAVEAAGPELANRIGEIVYWALMKPETAKMSPVERAIFRAIAQAFEKGGAYGAELAQTRTTVRIAAAMRVVGCILTGKAERVAAIWNTANAFVEPARPAAEVVSTEVQDLDLTKEVL